jgi:quinoprotein glucose dehydrogenase
VILSRLRAAIISICAVACLPALAGSIDTSAGEWPTYGGDLYSRKYSPLDQINGDNFSRLRVAWRWKSVDDWISKTAAGGEWWTKSTPIFDDLQKDNAQRWRGGLAPRLAGLKATPLMAGGVLYMTTALYQAAAIDAKTGETLWVFNPKSYETGTPTMSIYWNHRGPAYWTDGTQARLYWGTGDAWLYCVDAKTGRPCADFGDGGRVDIAKGVPRAERDKRDYLNALLYSCASPPLVVNDVVITGQSIADRRVTKEAPPGWVRGWDVRTGALKWTFKTIPQAGEFGNETWENGSAEYSGNSNVWTQMSADPELGLVYLPTGTPTNDFFGGHRLGDNLFAECVIAVKVETGERVWHFQTVHHGVWDYDNPAAPNLLDIVVDGKPIKALAQVTKQGFVFTFDRATGKPVWPIEERPVSTESNLPGERLSPTQPVPTLPAPFEYQGVSLDDLIDFTPELHQMALDIVKDYTIGALFTPPMLGKATIMRPGLGGGANWSGAAVDPETGILYVPSVAGYSVVHFYTPGADLGGDVDYTHGARGGLAQGPKGLPLFKPPYSRLTAINMNTGEHVWMTPTGNGDFVRNHEDLKALHLPPLGGDGETGPLLTKTLLCLGLGPTEGIPTLTAYDKKTGAVLGAVELPGKPIGTPMTYLLDGRQYIALTCGGSPPELVALALPE